MRIVYITTRNSAEAKKISSHLLKKRLIACANIFPIESMFWWDGEIQENIEFVILAKTRDENYKKVEDLVKKMHSYETPAVLSWKMDKVSKKYSDWVDRETGKEKK
jgi:periplasmic divalent cation tolerance protein